MKFTNAASAKHLKANRMRLRFTIKNFLLGLQVGLVSIPSQFLSYFIHR